MFCPKAGSLCLVHSRPESYLLNTNKARAYLYGGEPDFFLTKKIMYSGDQTGDPSQLSSRLNHLATAAYKYLMQRLIA